MFRVLDLGHNQLTGSLPSALFRLSALKILNLRHNKLTGSLPSELRALTRLGVLGLAQNHFFAAPLPSLDTLTRFVFARPILSAVGCDSVSLSPFVYRKPSQPLPPRRVWESGFIATAENCG
jgi:hypothetical protein